MCIIGNYGEMIADMAPIDSQLRMTLFGECTLVFQGKPAPSFSDSHARANLRNLFYTRRQNLPNAGIYLAAVAAARTKRQFSGHSVQRMQDLP